MNTEIATQIHLIKDIKQSVSNKYVEKDMIRFIQAVTDLINTLEKLDMKEEETQYYEKEAYLEGYQDE